MSKGTFGTPRTRATVAEIRPTSVKVRFSDDDKFGVSATLQEGNDVAGVFEVKETGGIHVEERTLNTADKAVVEAFLGLVIRLYADNQGYTGVTIS